MLLIPSGENRTATTIFEPNLKQDLLNTGQIYTWDSKNTGPNYISHRFIKAKPTSLHIPCLQPVRSKHTSWCAPCLCTSFLCVIKHSLCRWGTLLFTDVMTRGSSSYMKNRTASSTPGSYLSCPWSAGAYSLEAFLFYMYLKNSNLNLKYNFNSLIPFLN